MNADGSWSFDPGHAAYQHLSAGQTQQVTIPVTVWLVVGEGEGFGVQSGEAGLVQSNVVVTGPGTIDGGLQPGAFRAISAQGDLRNLTVANLKVTGTRGTKAIAVSGFAGARAFVGFRGHHASGHNKTLVSK